MGNQQANNNKLKYDAKKLLKKHPECLDWNLEDKNTFQEFKKLKRKYLLDGDN